MKAYFVGSIKGRENYLNNYKRIIDHLVKNKIIVIEDTLRPSSDEVYSLSDKDKIAYYKQVLKWINDADVTIAEVSHPSIGVGYEISQAVEKEKPVIILYSNNEAPHFLEGIQSDKVILVQYTSDDLEDSLTAALEMASSKIDTRFNFFISPKIGNYLDWVSKKKKLPRAVYLRKLIEEDMKKNREFEA